MDKDFCGYFPPSTAISVAVEQIIEFNLQFLITCSIVFAGLPKRSIIKKSSVFNGYSSALCLVVVIFTSFSLAFFSTDLNALGFKSFAIVLIPKSF